MPLSTEAGASGGQVIEVMKIIEPQLGALRVIPTGGVLQPTYLVQEQKRGGSRHRGRLSDRRMEGMRRFANFRGGEDGNSCLMQSVQPEPYPSYDLNGSKVARRVPVPRDEAECTHLTP